MTQRRLKTFWTKHLKSDEKEDFEALVRNSGPQFKPILEYLDYLESEVLQAESSEADYTQPSWAYLQAHRNGKKEIIEKIRSLFDF